jgi:hypothetical protein
MRRATSKWVAVAIWLIGPSAAAATMVLKDFDGPTVPVNLAGDPYPSWTDGRGGEGGVFFGSINTADAASDNSFQAHLVDTPGTGNAFYAQFNPGHQAGQLDPVHAGDRAAHRTAGEHPAGDHHAGRG